MRIAIRASWCRHVLGLALAGVVLPLAASSRPVRADLIFFKDGFALEGRVKREMTLEFDKVGGEMYHMPRGFFFLDDGPRRIFFSPSQVRLVFPKDPPIEEHIVRRPKRSIQVNAKNLPDLLEVLKTPEWDDGWDRRFTFRSPIGRIEVPQHIGLLTPHWARADSYGNYFWACAYLTNEFEPDTVRRLIASHPDFQDRKDQAAVQRVSRRLRKADFFAQAGWFDFAESELNGILSDMPEQKDRVEAARKELRRLRAREGIEKLKRRHLAGQHQWVRKHLTDLNTKELPDKLVAEVQELKADYENTDRLLADTSRLLDAARHEVTGANSNLLIAAAAKILNELNFENVGRLDAFLGQARQAERLRKKGKQGDISTAQLLSLAVSGWLLGSASAETSPETAARLWRGRDMVRAYLRSAAPAERKALLQKHLAGSRTESASLDELIQIIRTLPPVEAEKKLPEGIDERKTEGATYLLQLPPEYRHSRPTPVLVVLHQAGDSPRDMLNRWSDAAAENGYILAAPSWQPGGLNGNSYTYSERDHAIVLNTLRDLKRHFNVDEDRVFLFGLGEGGAMAFDVGLGHPDLFAGVLPMAAGPQFHAALCWRNGQYLPFYVVHGNRGPNGDKIRQQFELWVQRNFPMLWVDYKGRGVEWFAGEVPLMFDWMRSKKRYFPMTKLGTSGAGGMFGNEFCTLRSCDNRFYWLSTDDVRNTNSAEGWKVGVQPASLTARINDNNSIIVNATGVGRVTIWLGRNAKGEDMIDFDKTVTVTVGFTIKKNQIKVTASAEVMLEDLYQRGDRQQLFLANIPIDLKR
jgi:predicted esterase